MRLRHRDVTAEACGKWRTHADACKHWGQRNTRKSVSPPWGGVA